MGRDIERCKAMWYAAQKVLDVHFVEEEEEERRRRRT
jgi:hypothetical protein